MKITILVEQAAALELIIRCASADDPAVCTLQKALAALDKKIPATHSGDQLLLDPSEVLYGEFVGRSVFLYTHEAVLPTTISLTQLEQEQPEFFRCSKSMVVNLHKIKRLKSELSGRILATLVNGECILISRHYASALREKILKK